MLWLSAATGSEPVRRRQCGLLLPAKSQISERSERASNDQITARLGSVIPVVLPPEKIFEVERIAFAGVERTNPLIDLNAELTKLHGETHLERRIGRVGMTDPRRAVIWSLEARSDLSEIWDFAGNSSPH